MKIMSVVGARPNFMKVAPIIEAIRKHNDCRTQNSIGTHPVHRPVIHHVLVHTGQHYDQAMSGAFFKDLGLPDPDIHLGVGSGSHAVQTSEIMKRFEDVLLRERPDVLIVVGDVNSTLACSVVAAKIAFDTAGTRPIIAHVEAGLRSLDRAMPEEVNRIITDHIADLLFITEESGLRNLLNEGIASEKIHFVGNTMIDSLLTYKDKAESSTILDDLGLRTRKSQGNLGGDTVPYALLTLHRPSNVDCRDVFVNILGGLQELATDCPIIFSAHPRTKKLIDKHVLAHYFNFRGTRYDSLQETTGGTHGLITLIDPLGYLDFLCLMKHASLVITDSGGIQEETTCLGIPCVTVRDNTERPVTVTSGTNVIAGTVIENIKNAVVHQMRGNLNARVPEKWDGSAGARIVEVLLLHCGAEECDPLLAGGTMDLLDTPWWRK
jgi:UDP-N-acetylglucosamine 2-epimerase (non-hydrolysing)